MNYMKFNNDGHIHLTMFEKEYVISSMDEWEDACADITKNPLFPEHSSLMCSSSIDFPRDETDDEDIIAICNAVRGNSV